MTESKNKEVPPEAKARITTEDIMKSACTCGQLCPGLARVQLPLLQPIPGGDGSFVLGR